ncbi:MAG: hypothetical protein JXA14_22865 [Anaerolineae bacterium]|nr:hypothetical protein [Anaerolineae bacterium]
MTKRSTTKTEGVELDVEDPAMEELSQAVELEQEPEAPVDIAPALRPAPKHAPKDMVRVRINADHGMLAGRAVFRGEVHTVMYYQYVETLETGDGAYELLNGGTEHRGSKNHR